MKKGRRNRAPRKSLRRPPALSARWPIVRVGILLLVLVGSGIGFTWRRLRPLVVHQPQYLVDATNIHITPPPAWIGTDIRSEVLQDARLAQPLSILDDDLVERLVTAFEFHPWVANVKRVVKEFGPAIRIDVDYRKPVLMVQVDEGPAQEEMPADSQGVRLPDLQLSSEQIEALPRVRGGSTVPLVGVAWLDRHVIDAAQIADQLGSLAQTHGVTHVVVAPLPPDRMDPRLPVYDLQLSDGARIRWGHGPKDTQAGEPAPVEKTERLQSFLHQARPTGRVAKPLLLDLSRRPS